MRVETSSTTAAWVRPAICICAISSSVNGREDGAPRGAGSSAGASDGPGFSSRGPVSVGARGFPGLPGFARSSPYATRAALAAAAESSSSSEPAHRSRYTGWFSSATSPSFSGSTTPGLDDRSRSSLARSWTFPAATTLLRASSAARRSRRSLSFSTSAASRPSRVASSRTASPTSSGSGPGPARTAATRDARRFGKPRGRETNGDDRNDRERAERETPGRVATGAARAAARGDDANMRGELGGGRSASATCEGERRGRRDATSEATTKAVNCLGRVESK